MTGVPYTFSAATAPIPLSQLDANFNTTLTIGSTSVGLGNTVTTVSGLTLSSPTVTGTLTGAAANFSGAVGIGMTASNILDITQNQNAATVQQIYNNSGGTGALLGLYLNNATSKMSLFQFGASYTTSGVYRADGAMLRAGGAGGLTLVTDTAQPIYFGINNAEKFRITTDVTPRIQAAASTGVLGNNSDTTKTFQWDNAQFYPSPDNTLGLGVSSFRWTTVYATTALINTSDATTKQWLGDFNDTEMAVASDIFAEIGSYKFLDAMEEKGDKARTHVGVRAQNIEQVFAKRGLNGFDYGLLCFDKWEDNAIEGAKAGQRYGIRSDELQYFLIAALEKRLTALENK